MPSARRRRRQSQIEMLALECADIVSWSSGGGRIRIRSWVQPRLVGEVAYRILTPDGRLRHPSWRGLRPDREPGAVKLEELTAGR